MIYSRFFPIFVLIISLIFTGCIDETGIEEDYFAPSSSISTPVPTQVYIPKDAGTAKQTIVPDSDSINMDSGDDQSKKILTISLRKFTWKYEGIEWYLNLNFDDEIYNSYKNRSRSRDYDLFASDHYDDELIKSIADALVKVGKENGLSDSEIPYFAISFVQSLPYTSDIVTTGFDEFPRFPYETLYDEGGDCEDTSILSSAILQEMGYGVVLIQLPGHMAVGVKCSSEMSGYSYDFNGQRYCYLETTGENWQIGKMPDEYKDVEAKIIPVFSRPSLDIDFTYKYRYNNRDVSVDVDITVKNLGSETANNTRIYVSLQTSDTSKVWDQIESEVIQLSPESVYTYNVKNLHSRTGSTFRVYVLAYGDNVVSDEVFGDWITWKNG